MMTEGKSYHYYKRQALRDILAQKNIPNNPVWSDKAICLELSNLLGCQLRSSLDAEE